MRVPRSPASKSSGISVSTLRPSVLSASSRAAAAVSPAAIAPAGSTDDTLPAPSAVPVASAASAAQAPPSIFRTTRSLVSVVALVPSAPLTPTIGPLAGLLFGALRKEESPQAAARAATSSLAAAATPVTSGSVVYSVTNDWETGHNASLTVTAGSSALNGWTVEFDTPAQISNIWNAQITSHVGTHYVISNMSYNSKVAAGQSTSFGYQASPGAAGSAPTSLKLNGVAVGNPPVVPTVSVSDVSVAEGNSGTSNANFTVTLSKAATTAVTVGYSTANGTATAGSDYTPTSGTLTFAPGVTSQTVAVKVTGDTAVESDETFTVTLANASGATVSRATATGTITNDDVAVKPTVSISDVSVAEGNSGTSNANFTVTLSKAATTAVTVGYSTANGTATAGSDYTPTSGTLTFAPGVTSQTVAVKVTGDTAVEANETFTVTLANASGATVSRATATGTITNDDAAVKPTISISDATVTEGNSGTSNANFTVTLSKASTTAVTVGYSTANGTATAGSDFTAVSGTLTFAPGVTSQTVVVKVSGDTVAESNETFTVTIANASGATVSRSTATGTIANDDAAPKPTVSIGDVTVTEGNSGISNANFTVTLSGASTTAVTVGYSTGNGTATAGTDFTAASGTLTFAPGVTSQTVAIKVTGDTAVESNETFTVTLAGPSGATISRGSATGTITNDDVAPTTINVKDYGAVGDGITDDSAAIKAAQAALTSGERLYFPAGDYRFAQQNPAGNAAILIKGLSNVTVEFQPGARLLMDNLNAAGNGTSHGIRVEGSASNVTILNATIEWTTRPSNRSFGDGISVLGWPSDSPPPAGWSGSTGTVSNVSIINVRVVNSPQAGVVVMGSSDVTVTNLTAVGTLADGLHLNANRRVTVNGLVAQNTGDDGLAFVTYYDPSQPWTYGPTDGPFNQSGVGEWNNSGSTATNITVTGGRANGFRVQGGYDIKISDVTVTDKELGFQVNSAIATGPGDWTSLASRNIDISNVTINGAQTGVVLATNNISGTEDPMWWDFSGVVISDVTINDSKNWSLAVETPATQTSRFAGVTLRNIYAETGDVPTGGGNGGILLASLRDAVIDNVRLVSGHAADINLFGAAQIRSGVAVADLPSSNLTVNDLTLDGPGRILIQDIAGVKFGDVTSSGAAGAAVELYRVRDASFDTIKVYLPGRGTGAGYGVRLLQVNDIDIANINVTMDNHVGSSWLAVELSGGNPTQSIAGRGVRVDKVNYASGLGDTVPPIGVQDGPYGPVAWYIGTLGIRA